MLQPWVKPIAETCAALVELVGIVLLTVLAIYAIGWAIFASLRGQSRHGVWMDVREQLARSILLGLEFLVAADIIHTVAVELTYETVSLLALIVLIRTFLSFAIDVELTGRWPWQNSESPDSRSTEHEPAGAGGRSCNGGT